MQYEVLNELGQSNHIQGVAVVAQHRTKMFDDDSFRCSLLADCAKTTLLELLALQPVGRLCAAGVLTFLLRFSSVKF